VSPRDDADATRVRRFLEALGREFRWPARLYLSGGEGMVLRGLREVTEDLDITYEVDPAVHAEWHVAIRSLKERLNINVEEAGPGDFIPLPPGHESRAEFVGRFGRIDAFLLDPYSVALAKIDRGHQRDLDDIRALLAAGVIRPDELRRLAEAILPEYPKKSLKADPARFRRHLERALAPGDGREGRVSEARPAAATPRRRPAPARGRPRAARGRPRRG
jgi:hypothetical protein